MRNHAVSTSRRAALLLSTALLLACGEDDVAPMISDRVVTSSVIRGQSNRSTVTIFDYDGVQGSNLRLDFAGPMNLGLEIPVQVVSGAPTTAQAMFLFTVQDSAHAGTYTVSVRAKDVDGALSNTLQSSFEAL